MDCSKTAARLNAYIDGALDEHTLEAVEAHLESCAHCRHELAALRAVVAAAAQVRSVRPPSDLGTRIRESVRRASAQDRRCARVAGLLSAYVDEELSARQAELVEAHVSFCEKCAKEIAAIRTLREAAGRAVLAEPPTELRARIAEAVAQESARRRDFAGAWRRCMALLLRPRSAWPAYAGAAAVVIAAVLLSSPAQLPRQKTRVSVRPSVGARAEMAAAVPSVGKADAHAAGSVAASVKRNAPTGAAPTARQVRRNSGRRHRETVVAHALPRPKHVPAKIAADVGLTKPDNSDAVHEGTPSEVGSEVTASAEASSEQPPAPEVQPVAKGAERPPVVRVAAEPVIDPQKVEEMMKQIKAEAAKRRDSARTASIPILVSRF